MRCYLWTEKITHKSTSEIVKKASLIQFTTLLWSTTVCWHIWSIMGNIQQTTIPFQLLVPVALFTLCMPHLILLLWRIIFHFLSFFLLLKVALVFNMLMNAACLFFLLLIFDISWPSLVTIITQLQRKVLERHDTNRVLACACVF